MPEDVSSSEIKPPKRIWELTEQYLTLILRYEEEMSAIEEHAQKQILQYRESQGADTSAKPLDANGLLHYINEFVEKLLIYYAYYRSEQRSMATLFASIGITDHRIFAEMVRVSSDPRVKIQLDELDIQGVHWFLKQFINEYAPVERHKTRLVQYLPKLKEAVAQTHSGAMQRFLTVLEYVASDEAATLRETGFDAVSAAIKITQLDKTVNHVIKAIDAFAQNARNHPTFILTDSAGYFGSAELKEFDEKIHIFEKLREMFREHVTLSTRTEWLFRRHHTTLMSSLFEGTHLELIDIRDKFQLGTDLTAFSTSMRDCQGMLLGVSQAHTLFLEYTAYREQMLNLVDAYREIGEFLQSELLKILHNLEVQRNGIYLEVHEKLQQVLDGFQQTLLEVCSLEPTNQ